MAAAIELDVIDGAANLNTGGPKQSCVHMNRLKIRLAIQLFSKLQHCNENLCLFTSIFFIED